MKSWSVLVPLRDTTSDGGIRSNAEIVGKTNMPKYSCDAPERPATARPTHITTPALRVLDLDTARPRTTFTPSYPVHTILAHLTFPTF